VSEKPIYHDFRAGNVRHSLVDMSKANALLGYAPKYRIGGVLKEVMVWHLTP